MGLFYPRYFEFFDACTDALFERAGLPREKMLRTYHIDGIPLVDVRTSFLRPSRYGDTVVIESSFAECGRSSFSVCHKLYNGKVLAVEGVEKRVWVDAHQAQSIPIQKPSHSAGDPRKVLRFPGPAAGKRQSP
ncbi:MAG: thioesterase family protein [Candidatus Acidiferrales bacterium]|jgi:4-hydroxybenzoyl-CoA thioesterase